jgi:hypothetical protein
MMVDDGESPMGAMMVTINGWLQLMVIHPQ